MEQIRLLFVGKLRAGKRVAGLKDRPSPKGELMVVLFCGAAVVGAILALRFGIFVLLPAVLFAAAGLIAFGVLNGYGFLIIVFYLLGAAVSLEVGFLIGGAVRVRRSGKAEAQPGELIFRTEPDSRGERDQWVLVGDPHGGEQRVRHDRATLDEDGSAAPYVRSEPTVPIADFLATEQPPTVRQRLRAILSHGRVRK
jgi:hypothetical protein